MENIVLENKVLENKVWENKDRENKDRENEDREKQKEDIKQASDILKEFYFCKHEYEVSINFNIKTTILSI